MDEVTSQPSSGLSGETGALADVLEAVGDAVIDYAPDGTIRWASPSLATVLAYEPGDVIGTRLRLSVEDDLAEADRAFAQAMADGTRILRTRLRVRCADGTPTWVDSVAHFVRDHMGSLQHVVVSLRDVSVEIEAEQRFTLAMEHSAVGMALVAPNGAFLEVNAALCEMFSRDRISLMACTWQELTHPADLAEDEALVAEVLAGVRDSYRMRKRYLRPDGDVVWGDLSVSAIRDASGEVVQFVSQILDVTEVVATEERYGLLVEYGTDVVVTGSNDGIVTWVSPSVETLLGWQPHEVVGAAFQEYVHPDDRGQVGAIQQAVLGGSQGRFEARMRTAGGDWCWVAAIVKPVVDGDGKVIGRIAGWRDVHGDHLLREQVENERGQFRLLAENSSDIVALVNVDGTLEWVSPSVERVLGWLPVDLVGSQPWDIVHPDDRPAAASSLAEAAVGGGDDPAPVSVRLQTVDGRYLWMAALGHHATDTQMVVSFRLIEEQVRAHEALEAERTRLRADLDSQIEPHITMTAVRDDDGAIVDYVYEEANPAALAYLGMTIEQFRSATLMQMYPSAAAVVMRDMYSHTVETGEPLIENDYAYPNEMYAGEVRRYDLRGARLNDGISLSWEDVTDRTRLREMLEESEERYRLLAENASDVVYMIGSAGEVSWISPNVERTLGWTADELLGTSTYDLIHLDDRPRIDQMRLDVLAGRDIPVHEGGWASRFRCKDGSYRWMGLSTTVVRNDDGSMRTAVTGMKDVDALMRARETAENLAHQLQATLDSLLDPHVLLRPVRSPYGTIIDFEYVHANDAACAYNGIPRERLVGARLLDLMPEHGRTGLLQRYAAAVDRGTPLVMDDHQFHNDLLGVTTWSDVRGVGVGDVLSLTWREVTAKHEAAAALATSERKYRLLADNSSDVVLRRRGDEIVWVSPSLTDTLGWQPEEWLGQGLSSFVHPDDVPRLRENSPRIHSGAVVSARYRVRSRTGDYHWVDTSASLFIGEDGLADGIVSSFRVADRAVEIEAELKRRARVDDLTGLLKRDELMRRLAERIDRPSPPGTTGAVLFCDIDNFKHINDTYGHQVGDDVLRTVTDRLRQAVRGADLLARLGGDEFIIVLDELHSLAEAFLVAEKIRSHVAEDIPSLEESVNVTVSIGVTLLDSASDAESLIAIADDAMYRAKQAGRNRVESYPPLHHDSQGA